MKAAIDSERGRKLNGRQIAIVELVFATCGTTRGWTASRYAHGAKVNTQWHLYCLVHNIEKLAHHGYAR